MLLADIADAVDLDWSFVSDGRAQMAATGACEIPGFVRGDALPRIDMPRNDDSFG